MYVGIHGDYQWELLNGELLVSSKNPRVGLLKRFEAPRGFNNAEQAQWFVQGQIDIHGGELAELEREKGEGGG